MVEKAGNRVRQIVVPFGWLALAAVLWGFWTRGVFAVITCGACLAACLRPPRTSGVWRNPAGTAFAVLAAWIVVASLFSPARLPAFRSLAVLIPVLAGAYAIPMLLPSRQKIAAAMTYSAGAITILLGADLLRLWHRLGGDLLSQARFTEPYVMNHPNVASMMAAAGVFVLLRFGWQYRRRPASAALAIAGILVNLAYIVILASRGPQVAFAAACAAFGCLLPGWRRKAAWLILLAVAGGLVVANAEHINRRFASGDLGSLNDRTTVWKHTWKLAAEHPVIGHGFGKRIFEKVYYDSDPPQSKYIFPHAHSYWLKALFESGWIGVALHAAAWALLAVRLAYHTWQLETLAERLLPGSVIMLLLLVHVYGLGDYPDELVRVMMIWLVPVSLVITKNTA